MAERITPGTYEWDLYYAEHAQRYEFFTPLCKGKRVLDAACGVGFGTGILSRNGAASVLGVDLSEEALGFARAEHGGNPAVKFATGDCEALDALNETFDVVVSFETIEHLRRPERLVEGARKVLKPKGLFICSTPNILRHSLAPNRTFVNEFHHSEMHYADFEALMGKYFSIRSRYYQVESEGYLRHRDLLQTLFAVKNSGLWRMEAAIRKLLGKELFSESKLNGHLSRAIPGDYVIAPLEEPSAKEKTYIIVGEVE